MWAIRSQMESCKAFIAPSSSEFTLSNLKYKNEHHEFLKTSLNQNDLESDATKLDIHLVFEYNEGDQILGFTAPRSNRLYFVHDPNAGVFT